MSSWYHRLRRYWLVAAPFLLMIGALLGYFLGYRYARVDYRDAISLSQGESLPDLSELEKIPKSLLSSIRLTPLQCYKRGPQGTPRSAGEGFSYKRRIYRTAQFSNSGKLAYSRLLFEQKNRRYRLFEEMALSVHMQSEGDFDGDFSKLRDLRELFEERIDISDVDVRRYFLSMKDRLPEGMTLARLEPNIKRNLFDKQRRAIEKQLYRDLKDQEEFSVLLSDECPPQLTDLDTSLFPSYGSKEENPPWHFVLFASYPCVECRRSWDRLTSLVSIYPKETQLTLVPISDKEGSIADEVGRLSYCSPDAPDAIRDNFHSAAFSVPTMMFVPGIDLMSMVQDYFKDYLGRRPDLLKKLDICQKDPKVPSAYLRAHRLRQNLGLLSRQPTLLVNGRLFSPLDAAGFASLEALIRPAKK